LEHLDETDCATAGASAAERLASCAPDAYAVWIDASWRHGPSGAIPVLLFDPERRGVVLTRRLRVPLHLPLLAEGERQDILRKRLEQATGYPVRGLRMLCRLELPDSGVGGATVALAGVCTGPARQQDKDMLLLDIDQAMLLVDTGVLDDALTVSLLRYARQQLLPMRSLTILVCGPWRAIDGDPVLLARDIAAMEACVQPLFDAGHLPVLGEWLTAPTTRLVGARFPGADAADAVGHAHRLLGACDAVLRLGGARQGDPIMATARRLGKPVYESVDAVPGMRTRLVTDHPMLWC
jgi:hypothetical protein